MIKMFSRRALNGSLAALGLATGMTALSTAPAAAQDTPTCPNGDVTVVTDAFIPAFAVARRGAAGPEVAVNTDRGVGLGRETQDWLMARQCFMVAEGGASAPVGPTGLLEFSLAEHTDADCYAYSAVVEASGGRSTATRVVDRDVSAQSGGSYWDVGMGDIRAVSSGSCP